MGLNLDGLNDFNRNIPFADAMKSARGFSKNLTAPWDSGNSVPVDADGWPIPYQTMVPVPSATPRPVTTADFSTLVFTEMPLSMAQGTYKLSFTGKADVKVCCGSSGKADNLRYDGLANLTVGDVIVSGGQLTLSFTNTTSAGVRNVRLLRPLSLQTETFNKTFLEAIKPFSVIRFMDWTHTNDNPVSKWSDRTKVTDARQSGPKGVAWEYVIELANQSGKDPWINIPALADDDYVKQLAELLKAKLNKDRIVYVEYSNEVWNNIFKQNAQNQAAAEAEVAAYPGGKGDLNLDGTDTNKFFWARRRVAKRLIQVSTLFKGVIGSERVRPIYAAQIADPSHFKVGLEYIKKYWGEPKDLIYAISGAGYFNTKEAESPTATIETILNGLSNSIESKVDNWKLSPCDLKSWTCQLGQYAYMYGLKVAEYEAGSHLTGLTNMALKHQVQLDPRFEELFRRYYSLALGCGHAVTNQFTLASKQDQYGSWGMYQELGVDTPKSRALKWIASHMDEAKKTPCEKGPNPFPLPTASPTAQPTPGATP